MSTHANPPGSGTISNVDGAAPDDVVGPLDVSASFRVAAQASRALPALVAAVHSGGRRVAFTFAGQGAPWWDGLLELWSTPDAAQVFLAAAETALLDELVHLDAAGQARLTHGVEFSRWIRNPASAPPAAARTGAGLSMPMIYVVGVARALALLEGGLEPLLSQSPRHLPLVAGHSAGELAALAFSAAAGLDDGAARQDILLRFARVALHLGAALEDCAVAQAPSSLVAQAVTETGSVPGPMAAVGGLFAAELTQLMARSGEAEVVLAVQNAPTHHTLSGPPAALERFRRFLVANTRELAAKKKQGRFAGRAVEPRWNTLAVSGPFHTASCAPALERLLSSLDARGLALAPGELFLEVQHSSGVFPNNGTALRDACANIMVRPGSWMDATAGLVRHGVNTVVDVGPGEDVAHLTGSAVRGRGVAVWAAAQARQRAVVLNDRTAPALPTAWHTFAPTVFHVAGERPRLHNRFVERTGRPPVLVPGMTPTTVEAPLVVAAANAGFWAELAGGGQVTAEILRSRAQEMLPLLQPGEGYIFNALYLDPYLWNLHLGKDRTVFRLRAEGHPILGVTISAGIPPVEDAVALLDDLHAHGMTLNAFKPGTTEQIAQVLEIAKARPQFNVFVQVEGGKAGGHHSWEDLEDVIQRNYAALRALDNVVLCVGGGIGTEEQATAWLNGSWSQKLGLAPMPVDAVFLGTRLMATLEACTSPSVKAALVAAPGDVGQWPLDGKAAGGVVGGRSSLDAPLWLLDNAAARVAALLDEVAGDNAKVQARREEIIAALAGTAKPYIGDVAAMTPRDVLVRLGKLMPPARDDSWRARFVDVARRLEARFAAAAGPSLVRDDVENVAQLVEVMVVRLPQLATARMHPEDVRHFLETCRRPGKPVPFVPVLDADVRRWFKSDSLWQSHDVRFSSDAVLVIPGPAAVSAITRANEPVAHVLNDFVRHAMLDARVEPAPSPVSPLQRALALPDVRDEHNRVHPNPLVALFSGCPVALEGVTRLDGAGRTVAALAWDGQLRATLTVPNGPCLDLGLSFVADGHGGHLRWNRQAYLDAQHVFFSTAIFGEVVEPAPLFERVTQQITVDAQRVRLWCATTGTPATGSTRVPLVMAFSLAWKAIFQALAGARPDVLRLVHAGDQVEGPGFCVGETLSVTAAVTGLQTLEGGQQVTTLAQLVGDDGKVRATVTSRFFIRGSGAAVDRRAVDTRLMLGTPADVAFLKALPVVREFQEPAVPCVATLQGTISGDTLTAVMDVNGKTVGRVEAVEAGARVVDTLTQLLGERPARVALPSPVPLGTDTLDAPRTMAPYAQASGDHNPLHTNVGAAVLGGFTQPIVHGMWTASALFQRLVALTADGDHLRVTGFETTFLAPVLPGSALKMEARVVARLAGALEVHATVAAEETVVARAVMHVRQPSTGYVFPGQGVQHVGLGMESYARSPAARAVWDEADETCRARHGFSLLTVVRENPRELWVRGTRLVHPDGVLNLTQFTQVALAVAAVADVAELRDRAAFVEDALFAGHSLGEYSALAAVPRVMPLAAVVDIVYQRGLTMDRLVARDAQGRSPYAMGAMRPNLAGLTEAQALSLVVDTGAATGLPLFVVNHNVRNRQYAVTGDVAALKVLREKLLQRSTTQKPAWVDVPGIDVPFHSPLLRDGVDAFRATLDAALPKDVDAALLNHRYVPNLTGTVFRLERAFLQEVADATGSTRVKKWLDTWNDEVVSGATPAPNVLARALLIEVLAYQFASPVKWTGVQDVMFDRVQQCIEVGTARQPVLTGMARATVEQQPRHGLRVLHAALDRTAVVDLVAVVETPAVTGPVATTTAVPATVVAQASAPVNRGALPEPGAFAHDALRTLVCVLVKKSWTDVDPARSLDQLLGGNSARRNQVLAELAAELGGKAVDGAHELALQELSATVARGGGWTAPGPVLRAHQDQAIHTLFGAAGWDAARVEDTLQREWGLSPAHRARVLNRLTLGARNQTPASDASGAVAILENTVKAYASELGTDIPRQQTQAAVMTADPAALQALEARLWGPQGAFTQMARILVPEAAAKAPPRQVPSVTPLAQPEHDEAYAKACAPLFDEKRHVAFTSSWAWARRDLLDGSVPAARVARRLDACARAMALGLLDDAVKHGDAQRVTRLSEVLAPAPALTWSGKTALVTGAGEGSIARALVIRLLEQGARVVVTTTHPTAAVMRGFKVLYQAHAALGAELHVVPANQGSFSDVDALVEWVGSARRERVGSTDKGIKAPWLPDVLVPFGAMGETADLTSMGPRSLAMFRVLVLGVERLVARLAVQHQTQGGPQSRLHVLLPLSPNHGTFGGDGAYGECKAALEALLQKQHSESDGWGRSTTMVGARIGWVRGTGLMHKNDSAAAFLESRGLKTFSTDEMAELLFPHLQCRDAAPTRVVDVTGGLSEVGTLSSLLAEHRQTELRKEQHVRRVTVLEEGWRKAMPATTRGPATVQPLHRAQWAVAVPGQAQLEQLPQLDHLDLDEVVVVVGTGEVGPCGSGRTRWAMEQGGTLSVEAVLELAWMMGLIKPDEQGTGFVDVATGQRVEEGHAIHTYEKRVLDHSGVRVTNPVTTGFDPRRLPGLVEIRLERDFRFPVPSRQVAQTIAADDPAGTTVLDEDGVVVVVRKKGSTMKVPAALSVHRAVTGQVPDGWDATRYGVPKELVEQVDPVTLYCLVSTAEAFLSAGLEPQELYRHLHPGRVGITLGTGIGGMNKLKRLHRDFFEGRPRQNDTLQETLINVIGGYVVQAYLGSYGAMSFPVAACATAGVSMADALDKIRTGQADLVVAGGADDLSEAGLIGFGDMGATADTDDMLARGVEPAHMSRPNDARRRGFVEAQGAGVTLVCRASLAVKLGLPVFGVIIFAGTSGDGLQQSVPAPGQGALVLASECRVQKADPTACGFQARRDEVKQTEQQRPQLVALLGEERAAAVVVDARRRLGHQFHVGRQDISPLRGALAVFGLTANDVGVVSKHDSSTQANDLNEARLHETLQDVLGRDGARPLRVISQKALTGHPKGAAAAWQLHGLMQCLSQGVVPGNASLDDVDEQMKQFPRLVWSDRSTTVPWSELKAGLVTTLGFGHVSALMCVGHPFLFWRLLNAEQRAGYAQRLARRQVAGEQRLQEVLSGRAPLFVPRGGGPFVGRPEQEAAFLLDAGARL